MAGINHTPSLFDPELRREGISQLSEFHRGLLSRSKLALSIASDEKKEPLPKDRPLDQTIHQLTVRTVSPSQAVEILENGVRIEKAHRLPYPIAAYLALKGFGPGVTLARYLAPSLSNELPRRTLPLGTDRLAEVLLRAGRLQKHVVLICDYDVDGVTSAAVMRLALEAAGAKVSVLHPSRIAEGYGVSVAVATRAIALKPDMVVSLDCGTVDFDGVAALRGAGIPVAIVDHHRNDTGRSTNANIIINSALPSCRFAQGTLVTVGHAFLIAREMIQHGGLHLDLRIPMLLAAIGTLADIGTMSPQNRALVREGLSAAKSLADENLLPPGLRVLVHATAPDYRLDEYDVWFRIAPWINAPGRLTSVLDGCFGANLPSKLLSASSYEEAQAVFNFIKKENERRQQLEAQAAFTCGRLAERFVAANRGVVPAAFVLSDRFVHPGVAGPVASRITEKFHAPTIVISGTGTGSGRSIEGVDLYRATALSREGLEGRAGGHTAAVGVTLQPQDIPTFRHRFVHHVAEQRITLSPVNKVTPDFSVLLRDLSLAPESLAQQIKLIGPFGKDNPAPSFVLDEIAVKKAKLNDSGQHVSMELLQEGGVSRTGHLFHSMDGHSAFATRPPWAPINSTHLSPNRRAPVKLVTTVFTLSWRQEHSQRQELRLSVKHGWAGEPPAEPAPYKPKPKKEVTHLFSQQQLSFQPPTVTKITFAELALKHNLLTLQLASLRENQRQTAVVDEALSRFKKAERSVIIAAPQGEGKTTMAAAVISGILQDNLRALFLVPRNTLLKQIVDELHTRLSLPANDIAALSASASLKKRIKFCQNPPRIAVMTDSLAARLINAGRINLTDEQLGLVIFDEGHHGGEIRGPQRAIAGEIKKVNKRRDTALQSLVQTATPSEDAIGVQNLRILHGAGPIIRMAPGAGAAERTVTREIVAPARWTENTQRLFREAMLDTHDQVLTTRDAFDDALENGWGPITNREREIFRNVGEIWSRRTAFFPSQTAIAATIQNCVAIRERLQKKAKAEGKEKQLNMTPLAGIWANVAALGSARAMTHALAHEGPLSMLSLVTEHLLAVSGITTEAPYSRYHWKVRLLGHHAFREGLRGIIANTPYEQVLALFERIHLRGPTLSPANFEDLWSRIAARHGIAVPLELEPAERGAAIIELLSKDAERWLTERRFEHPKEKALVSLLEKSGRDPVIVYVPNKELGRYLVHRINTTHGLVSRSARLFIGGGASDKEREAARRDFVAGTANTLVASSAISEGVDLKLQLQSITGGRSVRQLILWSPVGWATQSEQLYGRVGRGEFGVGEVTVLVGRGIAKHDSGEFGVYSGARSRIRRMKSAIVSNSREPGGYN